MSQYEPPYFAFKVVYNRPTNAVKTPGEVINPNNNKKHDSKSFLWDTGATVSCLSISIINKLNLSKVSIKTVRTASGENQYFCYYVDIILLHKVRFKKILVIGLPLEEGVDALIGMDIINTGSFLFTTDTNTRKQIFEFSTPPLPSVHGYIEKAHKRNERNYKKLKRQDPFNPLLRMYTFPPKR